MYRGDLAAVLTAAVLQGRYEEVREVPLAWVEGRKDLVWLWHAADAMESPEPELILHKAVEMGKVPWESINLLEDILVPGDLDPIIEAFRAEVADGRAEAIAPGHGLAALAQLQELEVMRSRQRRDRGVGAHVVAALDALKSGDSHAISTGFPALDVPLGGGFKPGNLYYLGGHTGHGKSSLALQWARHVARMGRTVRMFSFEMLGGEIAMRALSQESGIPEGKIAEHAAGKVDLDAYDQGKVREAIKSMGDLPLRIDDDPGGDLEDVLANMARTSADLFILDHLHLMTMRGAETRQLEVSGISRRLKLFSVQKEVPVLALVQFKQPDARSGVTPPPTLASIRDSGAPAQDASGVFLLHQHRTAEGETERVTLQIAKNRGGPFPLMVELAFEGSQYLFTEDTPFG